MKIEDLIFFAPSPNVRLKILILCLTLVLFPKAVTCDSDSEDESQEYLAYVREDAPRRSGLLPQAQQTKKVAPKQIPAQVQSIIDLLEKELTLQEKTIKKDKEKVVSMQAIIEEKREEIKSYRRQYAKIKGWIHQNQANYLQKQQQIKEKIADKERTNKGTEEDMGQLTKVKTMWKNTKANKIKIMDGLKKEEDITIEELNELMKQYNSTYQKYNEKKKMYFLKKNQKEKIENLNPLNNERPPKIIRGIQVWQQQINWDLLTKDRNLLQCINQYRDPSIEEIISERRKIVQSIQKAQKQIQALKLSKDNHIDRIINFNEVSKLRLLDNYKQQYQQQLYIYLQISFPQFHGPLTRINLQRKQQLQSMYIQLRSKMPPHSMSLLDVLIYIQSLKYRVRESPQACLAVKNYLSAMPATTYLLPMLQDLYEKAETMFVTYCDQRVLNNQLKYRWRPLDLREKYVMLKNNDYCIRNDKEYFWMDKEQVLRACIKSGYSVLKLEGRETLPETMRKNGLKPQWQKKLHPLIPADLRIISKDDLKKRKKYQYAPELYPLEREGAVDPTTYKFYYWIEKTGWHQSSFSEIQRKAIEYPDD